MAAARKTVRRTGAPAARDGRGRLARTWDETRAALDIGRATIEKRARALLKTSGVDPDKAAERLTALGHRLGLERREAARRVEGRLVVLRARARKERRVLISKVDEAVRRALVALDIPSRKELHALTRRVEDLSRQIDARYATRSGPRAKARAPRKDVPPRKAGDRRKKALRRR